MPGFEPAPSRVHLFSAAACMVMAILTCLMIAINALEIIRVRDAMTQMKTQAAVISSVVKSGCARGKLYYADVRYRYAVDGQDHVGRRISFGDLECGSHEKAILIIERFPQGTRVDVYYDPAELTNQAF